MDHATRLRFGWIGLGSMGLAMSMNLQRYLASTDQPSLRYNNRTMSRGDILKDLGGVPHDSISELLDEADIIFMSISTDEAVMNVVSRMLESPGRLHDKIVVNTSTIHPDTTKHIFAALRGVGAKLVMAPVFGPSPMAESGELLFAIAGPSNAVRALGSYVKGVLGRDIMYVGEDVTKASLLKVAGNFLVAGIMEIVAEALVFAEKTELGTGCLEELMALNFGPETYAASERMTSGDYAPLPGSKPQSDVALAVKDIEHSIRCAAKSGASLKVAELALQHLLAAQSYAAKHNGQPLDSSSMYGILRMEAGLDF